MAIRERKSKDGKTIIAHEQYFNHPFTGKRVTKRFKSKRDAAEYDSTIKHRLKFDRDSFKPEEDTPEAEIVFMTDLMGKYLADRPMSKKSKRDTLHHMKAFYTVCGNPKVEEINKKLMLKFERGCRTIKKRGGEEGLSQNSIHRKVGIIKAALAWAVENEEIPGHNLNGYRCEKGEDKKFIPPSPKELNAIIEVAPPHLQRAIEVSFAYGLRVGASELFKLEWRHIDLDEKVAHIPAAVKNKKVQWRDIMITNDFAEILAAWKAEDEAKGIPWVVNYAGKQVTSIRKSWNTALKNAGIDRPLRPYDLRHAFATQLLAMNHDAGAVAQLMGHSSTSMIYRHYQHVLDDQKRAALEAVPRIGSRAK